MGMGSIGITAARAGTPSPLAGDPSAPAWPAAERFPLWPGVPAGAPDPLPAPNWTMGSFAGRRELWVKGVATPDVAVFRSPKPDGSAVLVLPGGAYSILSVQNEGIEVARRLNALGLTVLVLSYRLPGEGWANRALVPLSDAQRAMRLVRARAASLRIDPARLGVLGFSAGGHLAADLSTGPDAAIYPPVDQADRLSARPAFSALIYPVTSFEPGLGHQGSRDNLLGPGASQQQIEARSPLDHLAPGMAPCFVAHAFDDDTVPVQASIAWLTRCRELGIPAEGHLYEKGGHGFGVHLPASAPASRWPEAFNLWMRSHLS